MSGVSSIIMNENNLNSIPATFDASLNSAPYNKLYLPVNNATNLSNCQIGLQKLHLYYSWPNINASNNTFTIQWKVAGAFQNFTATIPANTNYSSVSDLNSWLQSYMISQGMYLVTTSTGNNVYYLEFVANPNYYGVNLNLYLVPTALPGTCTQPSNFLGYPTVSCTPTISFPATNNFYKLIGYAPTTVYNGGASAINYKSTFCPQLSPVSSILVSCNIAFNPLSLNGPSTIISTFTSKGTTYGSLITNEPNEVIWYDINSSMTSLIQIDLLDQNYMPIPIQDPEICIQLLIRPKPN